eukprot:4983660-Prymnesium_polylepis.1
MSVATPEAASSATTRLSAPALTPPRPQRAHSHPARPAAAPPRLPQSATLQRSISRRGQRSTAQPRPAHCRHAVAPCH